MSLFGSLFSAVSGLNAQSNNIGIISDNVSNINTIGYKGLRADFQQLVTNSSQTSYSPGGVLSSNRQNITEQGLIQGTNSSTDVAISGDGFFVVNTLPDGTGTTLVTRAGGFRQDSNGNFRNSAGYYLMAWELDRNSLLPGEPGNVTNTTSSANLSSLGVVNVSDSSGTASDTTNVEISANLDASQTVFPGAGLDTTMDSNHTENFEIAAEDVLIPGGANSLARGDKFTISTGAGTSDTFRYDGFTFSRSVTAGTSGDSAEALQDTTVTLAASNPFTTNTTNKNVAVVSQTRHGLTAGQTVTISGNAAAVGGVPASDLNRSFVVQSVTDEYTFVVTVETQATSATSGGTASLTATTRSFDGNIMDASTTTELFLANSNVSDFTTSGLSFTITTQTAGTRTFTYTASSPNSNLGQFNNLTNLANAISAVDGLTSRVEGGRLYVSPIDANEAITFANGSIVGTQGSTSVASGIDWVRELGFNNTGSGTDRFSTLQGLSNLINTTANLTGAISNPLSESTLRINVDDPLDTISFADLPVSAALTALTGSTPFTSSADSNTVTISMDAPHGFSSDDLVALDPTGIAGYPSATTAVNAFTTDGTSTVVVTQTAHGFSDGDVIFIDASTLTGYPSGNINGIPMTDFDGLFTVASSTANTYEITTFNAATSSSSTGAGTFTASPTIGGIPLTALNGTFRINVTSPSEYEVSPILDPAIDIGDITTDTGGAAGLIVTPHNNAGSILAEFGFVDSLDSASFTPQAAGPLGPQYDASDSDSNMAGGEISPQFSQNIRIFDSLGSGHDMRISYIKVDQNTWAAEMYAVTTDEVDSSFSNGLVASGTITFNGDGTLRNVSSGLSNAISIIWTNGAEPSGITMDWGTAGDPEGTVGATAIGETDGLSQFDAAYIINSVSQDGNSVGELVSISIGEDGTITAQFSNGESQDLFKIPLAAFPNPDQLQIITGNVFSQTANSGELTLREAGTGGTGDIISSALEQSTSDLAEELTNLIVAQRSYQANTRIVSASDELLEELSRL